jgi:hypothetical protein
MTTFLLLLPAALSLLVLAAHFLRGGMSLPVIMCLVLMGFLWVPRPWATRTLQIVLVLGAAEWIRTTMALVSARQVTGAPWERMAMILGIVALVTFASAAAFELPALKRRDGRAAERPAD